MDWENIRNEDDSDIVGERVQNEDRNLAGSGIKDKNKNRLRSFGNYVYLRDKFFLQTLLF